MNEWIPVEERLPRKNEDVIFLLREVEHYGNEQNEAGIYRNTYHGSYDDEGWYTNWCYGARYVDDTFAERVNQDCEYSITHWFPIPEPPTKTDNGVWTSVQDGLPEDASEDVFILYLRIVEHYGTHKDKIRTRYRTYQGYNDGGEWYTNWCHGCKYIADTNKEYPNEEITVTHWYRIPTLPKNEKGAKRK